MLLSAGQAAGSALGFPAALCTQYLVSPSSTQHEMPMLSMTSSRLMVLVFSCVLVWLNNHSGTGLQYLQTPLPSLVRAASRDREQGQLV